LITIKGVFREYISEEALFYAASDIGVSADLFSEYDFSGRSAKLHRTEIRETLNC